jgi:hypothetical protein
MSRSDSIRLRRRPKVAVIAVTAVALAACGRLGAPVGQRPLDPAAQRAAAEKLARGFAEVCLSATDAPAATRALQAQGWPPFAVVWNQPGSVFYAAKPSPASPAGLFVMNDVRRAEPPMTSNITCVGHYPAEGAGPMIQAMERRWGASHGGPVSLAGSRAWTFRMAGAALTTVSTSGATDGPVQAAEIASLGPGEALVYFQVSYNPLLHDVASVASAWRPAS